MLAKVHREWDVADTIFSARGFRFNMVQLGIVFLGFLLAYGFFKLPLPLIIKGFLALIPASLGLAFGVLSYQDRPLYKWVGNAFTFLFKPKDKKWQKEILLSEDGFIFFPKNENTTQSLLVVKDIKNNMLLLQDGSYCAVLRVSGINIALLAQTEQERVYSDFKGLLNSLKFPIQILVRLRKQDIDGYLEFIAERISQMPDNKLKEYLISYGEWTETRVEISKLLSRERYIVIPAGASFMETKLTKMFTKEETEDYDVTIEEIKLRIGSVIRVLDRMGLEVEILDNNGLKQLIYGSYNPTLSEIQKPAEDIRFAVRGIV